MWQLAARLGLPAAGPLHAAGQLDFSLTQPTSAADSPHDFAAALGAFASGVTLVTIADGRDDVGVTVSAFCPVSMSPPLVLISLIGGSYPAELLGRLDRFAVTVLASGQRMLAGRFAATGRPGARLLLDDVAHHRGAASGALIPDGGARGDGVRGHQPGAGGRSPAGDRPRAGR